ncbi:hypothetical protein BDD12DRAFT_912820 [Trichophaea hybrida]|nr:hypothetical protein BDD12DRAFT_912820 [Trichophaea hybrida]
MSNYIGATHYQFEGSTLHGGQHWSTIIHYHGDGSQDSHDRERSREVLKPLVAKLETNSFLDLLLPMTDHVKHISKTSSIDSDDPKLYWILRNADFKIWESADNSQVLWLFGGPPGCSMTGVSSFIAKQEASRRNDGVFYFSCLKEGSDAITFTHSVLRHILNGSEPRQAKSIIKTFLSTLLFKIIQQDRSRFRDGRSSVITVEEILKAEGDGLLEALTEAVVEMKTIPDMPIVIDGIDKIGLDGSRFLTRFCSNSTVSPKPKVLLTCRLDPTSRNNCGIPCIVIEYDKERQECLNSLRHHATRYDKIETEHHDTLKWLWEHKQYRAWSSTSHSDLLLIEGKPGSGKSTLTKYFKDNLLERESPAKQAISSKELDEFYERMLRELEDNDEQRDVNDGIAEIQQALAIPDDVDAEYSPSDKSFEDGLIKDIVKRIIYCGGNFLDIRGNDTLQFTHQTALTFFSRLLEPTATSKFRMNEDDAHRRISIICIRYLMLCVARSTPENEPPSTEFWETAHFEKYAEYLNRRPFIDYALCHFQQHKNDCVLRLQQRKNDCHQCVYDERLVSQLSKKMTSNSASLLFESWIESYLGVKGFIKNIFHIASIAHLRIESCLILAGDAIFRAVEALLSAGTEKEACLLDKTPLLMSAEAGDVATAEVLLRKGARIDAKDNKKQTALLLAATKGTTPW